MREIENYSLELSKVINRIYLERKDIDISELNDITRFKCEKPNANKIQDILKSRIVADYFFPSFPIHANIAMCSIKIDESFLPQTVIVTVYGGTKNQIIGYSNNGERLVSK